MRVEEKPGTKENAAQGQKQEQKACSAGVLELAEVAWSEET